MTFDPKPGLEIGGRYRLVSPIGGDVLGDVWMADSIDERRTVTVKFLRGEGVGREAVAHVWRAAMLVERLGHDGAMPILDVQQVGPPDETIPVAVAPFVAGRDFDQWLRIGARTLREAVALLREAVDVLESAHHSVDYRGRETPLEHLGLKPSEIFVADEHYRGPHDDKKMRVRILDLGLVRDRIDEDDTGTFTTVGSPRFESPEIFASPEMAGPWSDVWSIGVMLYVVASGRYPYGDAHDTPFQIQRKIVERDCPTLDELAPDLPIEFCALVDRCLSRNPSVRFEDAAALGRALDSLPPIPEFFPAYAFPRNPSGTSRVGEAILSRTSTSVPPPAPLGAKPRSRRRRASVAAIVLSLVGGAVLIGYSLPKDPNVATASASTNGARRASSAHLSPDARLGAVTTPSSALVAELVADNPFRSFRAPSTERRLGCASPPPITTVEVEVVQPQAPVRMSMISNSVLGGLPRTGTCDRNERKDEQGRCWVLGCPGSASSDGEGHCISMQPARAPIQSCFHPDAAVAALVGDVDVTLQEHEVTWRELGRYLSATRRRAFVAVDLETSTVRGHVWDGTVPDAVAMLPAHGIPRPLAAAYCQAIDARLPSEAELETAARGRSFATGPWGHVAVAFGTQVPALGPASMRPHPVRDSTSLDRTIADEPIFDLVSNVREWAVDLYRPDTRAPGVRPAAGTPSGAGTESLLYGVVRGLPLIAPKGWPRANRSGDLQALLPVPAAYRTPVCAAANGNIVAPGMCADATSSYLLSLRDVGFRCARSGAE